MRTIKLSLKQSFKLYNNKYATIRLKRDFKIYYISNNFKDGYIVKDWTGKEYKNIKVIGFFDEVTE